MSHTKIRALQQWCKALVDGYKDVNITNMSSSWKDGLAFCALIHRFRPDLINFDALSKNNVFDNNQLAFTVAESIGIPALLEAKDMDDLPVPDKLSVITYVASMHNYFKDKEKLGGPDVSSYKGGNIQIGTKRHQDNDPLNTTEPKRSTPDQSEEKTKKISSTPTRQRSPADDLCTLCGGKVYLIEKQIDNGKLYHRSCFRSSVMSPTSKILSRSFSNGTAAAGVSAPEITAKTEQTVGITENGEKSKSPTKVRLFEKKKEQIQKAEEKLKAERQRENELYEKRQNTPSALRNHLKNIDNQNRENSRSSSDSPASKSSQSRFFSKPTSPERENTPEQPSWAQTKLRKVFDNPVSISPTALTARRDSSGCTEKKQSRESSPGSPVLMMQVTTRTMGDNQLKASRSVTKTSTTVEAEAGKTQLRSGLLKSLANIRQRQSTASSPSPTSPPPQSPFGPAPSSKSYAAPRAPSPVPIASNSTPFSKPLNSVLSTPAQPILSSTALQAKTRTGKVPAPVENEAPIILHDPPRSRARVKSVITSTPTKPAAATVKTEPLTETPAHTASSLSGKSMVTNGSSLDPQTKTKASTTTSETPKSYAGSKSSPTHSVSPVKSNLSKIASESSPARSASPVNSNLTKIATENSSRSASPAKSHFSKIASESSPSRSVSPAKTNLSKIASENSPSRSVSPAKTNVSKIASENSSNSASPAKSNLSKITSESSPSRSVSPAKSNFSKIASESSPSRSVSPAKSNVSKITSESSLSKSSSPARSGLSKLSTPPLRTDSPTRLAKPLVGTTSITTNGTDKSSTSKDNKPQSLLQRIEQYSKVAAGVEKPPSVEGSPKREIILENNNLDKVRDKQSSPKQNAFTATTTSITPLAIKKPLASESTKECNTVTRHVASPMPTKKNDDESGLMCMPPPVVKTYHDKNGQQISSKAEITKDVKKLPLVTNLSKTEAEKTPMPAYSPRRSPFVKKVEDDKKSTPGSVVVSTIGLTKLHPAHYNPKSSDSSPKPSFNPSNTATVQSLDTRVNPIPKPRRQKHGLSPSTMKENKENPVESKLNHSNGANSHKTVGALSERQDTGDTAKTEWQLEAERRIAARRGKYVDPETHLIRFVLPDSGGQLDNEKNGDANQNIRPIGQKTIPITQNWTFNDDSLNSSTSLDFAYRKHILPKQDLDSLEWSNPKKRLSTDEIQKELMDIDSKLTDLELRGRQLEVTIRAANEDEENFMVEWFQLINEKNELVRRENDLIYKSQEQELEEEQIRIDKELQALMKKPYEKKSKAEKRKEEELIHQKIAVVNQRNLIVDSIDEDRLRYQEEDEGIKEVLQSKGYI